MRNDSSMCREEPAQRKESKSPGNVLLNYNKQRSYKIYSCIPAKTKARGGKSLKTGRVHTPPPVSRPDGATHPSPAIFLAGRYTRAPWTTGIRACGRLSDKGRITL
jgi:hypothetical protein